jgi:hypothetical protein
MKMIQICLDFQDFQSSQTTANKHSPAVDERTSLLASNCQCVCVQLSQASHCAAPIAIHSHRIVLNYCTTQTQPRPTRSALPNAHWRCFLSIAIRFIECNCQQTRIM